MIRKNFIPTPLCRLHNAGMENFTSRSLLCGRAGRPIAKAALRGARCPRDRGSILDGQGQQAGTNSRRETACPSARAANLPVWPDGTSTRRETANP